MLLGLTLLGGLAAPLRFAAAPPASQFRAGELVARASKGPDRALFGAKLVLATWFDGRIHRAGDTAYWVGPDLAARELGFLATRGRWSPEATANRWQAMRTRLDGRLWFILRLSELPRLDPFEFGIGKPSDPDGLQGVEAVLTYQTGKRRIEVPLRAEFARALEEKSWEPILNRGFADLTPLASLFEAGAGPAPSEIPLGDYYGRVELVSTPVRADMGAASSFELTVTRPGRQERGSFSRARLDERAPSSGHWRG